VLLEVSGTVRVPGDKSISHRALLFAAFSPGASRVRYILPSADVHSSAAVMRALGVRVPELSEDFVVHGVSASALVQPSSDLDCGNSGTTTRLAAGIVAGRAGISARFIGDASLSKRPMQRIARPLSAMGARVESERGEGLPMWVYGASLAPIEWRSEHASAQIKSAILLAAVSSGVGATVYEPSRSRDHTERMLSARGVSVSVTDGGVSITGNATLHAADVDVPADPSSAAFFVALAGLAARGELILPEVCLNPTRTGGFDILARMGVRVTVQDERTVGGELLGTIVAAPGSLRGTRVQGDEVPRAIDEMPLIACVAARAEGETRITDASELRVKESDRISAVVSNLRNIGVDAEELPDGMVIRGGTQPLRGAVVTHGDHRLAMAFGILAALPGNAISIDDRECVAVSFPNFWELLASSTSVASSAPRTSSESSASGATAAHSGHAHSPQHTPLVIAIDGPAASGKSSTAQWVAKRLGVRHVDSGAFYRALTAAALRSGVAAEQWTEASVLSHAPRITRALTERSVVPTLDGDPADTELRGNAVTQEVSRVARMSAVREWVNDQVRAAGASTDVVVDGRDIGTAVFPNAPLKVFLIADPWERARRRLVQRLERRPTDAEIAEETEALVARDAKDATQSRPDPAAITIDTTTLTQEEQVERIVALAEVVRRGLAPL
jgi:3-phosphoshikimate 1-carboxyvinyltransferase